MDIGNFFRGIFGGNKETDEEKKRKAAAAKAAADAKAKAPKPGLKSANELFGIKTQPAAPTPKVEAQKPVPTPVVPQAKVAPALAPKPTPVVKPVTPQPVKLDSFPPLQPAKKPKPAVKSETEQIPGYFVMSPEGQQRSIDALRASGKGNGTKEEQVASLKTTLKSKDETKIKNALRVSSPDVFKAASDSIIADAAKKKKDDEEATKFIGGIPIIGTSRNWGAGLAAWFGKATGDKELEDRANNERNLLSLGMTTEELEKFTPEQQEKLKTLQNVVTALGGLDVLGAASLTKAPIIGGIKEGVKEGVKSEAGKAIIKESLKQTGKQYKNNVIGGVVVGGVADPAIQAYIKDGQVDWSSVPSSMLQGGLWAAALPEFSKQKGVVEKMANGQRLTPEESEALNQALRDSELPQDEASKALRDAANDPASTALERKKAKDQLAAEDEARKQAEFDADPLNKPAFQVRRELQQIITREQANLERFVNENPQLTRQQLEAASEAANARVIQLTDELKAGRRAAVEAVDGQEAAVKANADQRAEVAQEVADKQVAVVTPAQGDGTPAQSADPEVQANDAYASQYNDTFDMTDEILRQAEVDVSKGKTKESGIKKFFSKATGGIISDPYKDVVDKIRNVIADAQYKAIQGGNIFTQAPQRVAALFANNSGIKDSLRQILRVRNDAQSAAGDAVKRLHDNISDKVSQLPDPEGFNTKLDQVFETPEFLARKYGEGTPNIGLDQLPPAERAIVDQLIAANKLRNLALFRQGKISQGEYQLFADGMHSPRLYDFEKQGIGQKGNKLIDTTSTQKRKDLSEISDETFDKLIESPAQRMLIRLEMAMRSNASNDALKALDDAGMLLDRAPNNQFSPLEGARWGNYQGKFVYNPIKGQLEDSIIFNTKAGQAFGDLVDQYRNSPFGKADRFLKKTKTVYSPGTFIGNVLSNPLLFNSGAGVNPLGQGARMARAGFDLVQHRTGKTFNADIYEAQKYGVFSSDTGKQITGENNPQLTVANNKRINPFESAYGGADDAAKLAIWRGLRRRGVSPEKAAIRVGQFTQDYNNAGRLVRSLADMPVIGKPFARFAPELVRLVKNNVLYNPVGMVAGAGMIALLQNQLSEVAGETPEEREARETAVGQSLIPGTAWLNKLLTGTDRNISLNFPVGDSAINIARAVGLNFPQDTSGDPNAALINSIVPWAVPTRENAQGDQVFAPEELFTSLALSPIARQIANRDFMGREITDPENKTYYENGDTVVRKFDGAPSEGEQLANRAKNLFMQYVPLANEGQAIASAVNGTEDYYGKERTIPEAVARMFGFKTESNTQEKQKERVETKQYFDEDLQAVQDFVKTNPDLADLYFKLKNPTRGRETNTKVSDLVTPEKWDIINSDTSGRLYNFLKTQNIAAHDKSVAEQQLDPTKLVRPIDPVFQLPDDQAKYVTELRSRPSGDDIEAQDILRATSNWYAQYEDNYFSYLDENSKYFDSLPEQEGKAKENPRVTEYGTASKPVQQPPIVAEYLRIKAADPDRAKEVYKANKDALSAAFDSYAVDRLNRINALRKIEGYEPISLETYKNKTFGFDVDGGGFSSGGGGASTVNTLGRISDFSSDVTRIAPVAAQEMPNSVALFQKLMANKSGGRTKPRLGASSSGT